MPRPSTARLGRAKRGAPSIGFSARQQVARRDGGERQEDDADGHHSGAVAPAIGDQQRADQRARKAADRIEGVEGGHRRLRGGASRPPPPGRCRRRRARPSGGRRRRVRRRRAARCRRGSEAGSSPCRGSCRRRSECASRHRPTAQPMIGMAITAPAAMTRRPRPRIAGLIPRRSWTSGMCTAQRPGPAPRRRNATETATRARKARASRSATVSGVASMFPLILSDRWRGRPRCLGEAAARDNVPYGGMPPRDDVAKLRAARYRRRDRKAKRGSLQ